MEQLKNSESYSRALARHGRKTVCIEGDKAALAGLTFVHLELERQKVMNDKS